MAVYVVGHKSPDTDSVCSAIAYAELKKKVGVDAVPARQGDLNPETTFVLEKFGFDVPELVTDATGKRVILVDHSEVAQSLDNLDKGEIVEIVDHHKIGDVTTPNPIFYLNMPVGSTATVVKKLYEDAGVEISKEIAGILLASILSDTVILKSATTTDIDRKAAEELAKIAGVDDIQELGMEMFKRKSELEGKSAKDLLFRDFKNFDMSGNKVGIGQIEVVSLSLLDNFKDALYEEMQKLKEAEGYHSIFLMLTDIIQEGTELLCVTDDPEVVKKAFDKEIEGRSVWLPGVMSRKKQVVPNFEKAFSS
ncbi:Inorganic pyrophosphatase/exopolyphosphatase [Archaeoglobus sulfaticallidus PM70-1]|uniref:inorganic diphosphatase n=1 Tax=Archaeoglobus sulfaticallidus PM70-1 TaxID=387631 RepID=N0B9P5_9EURY|nr:manganese-dependent inorganic pyrophosphatase [Archaeoglobus sulfaticallidus]AGK60319.1 Inorganic pyrophosphatase/exopolyphosphatase [Archaeoglobus sulfaticallidus PM70-1]